MPGKSKRPPKPPGKPESPPSPGPPANPGPPNYQGLLLVVAPESFPPIPRPLSAVVEVYLPEITTDALPAGQSSGRSHMAHPNPEQPTTHSTQQGVGEGTADRRRRKPRTKVDDISVSEASGLSLGVDGFPHPIETDALGRLRIHDMTVVDLLEELVILQRQTVLGLSLLTEQDLSSH